MKYGENLKTPHFSYSDAEREYGELSVDQLKKLQSEFNVIVGKFDKKQYVDKVKLTDEDIEECEDARAHSQGINYVISLKD